MPNLYFENKESENCFPLNYFQHMMTENGIKEMQLLKAVPQQVEGFFWCKHFGEVWQTGCCGKQCESYRPKNGKSGCCTHFGKTYEASEKVKTIRI